MSATSRVWFTLSRGIVTEVFYPRIDQAALRDCGFLVTSSDGFFCEEQRDCLTSIRTVEPGVPAYIVENRCKDGRFQITKEIITDPHRDVLLQRVKFAAKKGSLRDFNLCLLLSPRLGDQGADNSAWTGEHGHQKLLLAQREDCTLSVASSAKWLRRSVGFVGVSDAWQDLRQHGRMTWEYDAAEHGHVALAGEIDLEQCNGEFVLAMAFNGSLDAAALISVMAINDSFDDAWKRYIEQWQQWHQKTINLSDQSRSQAGEVEHQQRRRPDHSRPNVLDDATTDRHEADLYRVGMMTLKVHRPLHFDGAGVASLSEPWGEARGDDDLGGYHLVWPRDLVEECGGLLAGGAHEEVVATLKYLQATQKNTGGWPQDMWLSGSAYADGVQLDEAALPILLVGLAERERALDERQVKLFWPMVRSAAGFIVRVGPSTGQDRWENTPGLSPYTLATEVAALLLAGRLAERFGEGAIGQYLRETADLWNGLLDEWTYVRDTELARKIGVEGYYVRIAPRPGMKTILAKGEPVPRLQQARGLPVTDVVSADALALVRFGLRAADDPRILNTIKVIDACTRVELPAGSAWRRYNGDYYGEHDDGTPSRGHGDRTGLGRPWPLLSGERGHYAIARGDLEDAKRSLATMGGLASQVGFIPEQCWDAADLPDKKLFLGRPSGSAMPLAWAHAEYVRLHRSIRDQAVFDLPQDAWQRYVKDGVRSNLALWRFNHQATSFSQGRRLRIELLAPATVRFSVDRWQSFAEESTSDSGLGFHFVDLPTEPMESGDRLSFTFRWTDGDRWEGRDFFMEVEKAS